MDSMTWTRVPARCAALTLACSLPLSVHAQLMGIFQAGTSVFVQATSKLGAQLTGQNKPQNLEAEREKFFASAQGQFAGMDPATRKQLTALMEKQWSTAEDAILMRNGQAARGEAAPVVDFGKVARDALGGFAVDTGIAAGVTPSGLGGVVQSATLAGLVSGTGSQATGVTPVMAVSGQSALAMSGGFSGAVMTDIAGSGRSAVATAGTAAMTSGVSSFVAAQVSRGMESFGFGVGGTDAFVLSPTTDPTAFFGKRPGELSARDLYRENGNLGYKRVEFLPESGTEAYVPLGGDPAIKAIVYQYDASSGTLRAAFRILKLKPLDFKRVVDGVAQKLGAQPRYSGTESMMRALWADGTFVTADAAQVTAGWSALVPQVYANAAVAANQ
jgi:hypothetical protein